MPHRLTEIATTLILLGCVCLLVSCTDSAAPTERLPTVGELRSRNLPATTQSQSSTTQPIRLIAQRFDLPLNGNLDKAWALVHSQEHLSPEAVRLWKSNGLRVGLLAMSDYQKFVAALPPRLAFDSGLLISQGEQVALHTSAPIKHRRRISVVTADGESIETLPLGMPQFLIELLPAAKTSVFVYLTPHHHIVHSSVMPRPQSEIDLDGRIFHELILEAELDPKHILVVAWSPPPPPPEKVSATAPATGPAIQNQVNPAIPPLREARLGDLLLTAERLGQPSQRLLLFGLPTAK